MFLCVLQERRGAAGGPVDTLGTLYQSFRDSQKPMESLALHWVVEGSAHHIKEAHLQYLFPLPIVACKLLETCFVSLYSEVVVC